MSDTSPLMGRAQYRSQALPPATSDDDILGLGLRPQRRGGAGASTALSAASHQSPSSALYSPPSGIARQHEGHHRLAQQPSTSAYVSAADSDPLFLGGGDGQPPTAPSPQLSPSVAAASPLPPIIPPLKLGKASLSEATINSNAYANVPLGGGGAGSSAQQQSPITPSVSMVAEPSVVPPLSGKGQILEHYLMTMDEIRDEGVFGQRAVYQDAHAELRSLEAKRATKFAERYEVVQTWPDWRQRLHRFVKRDRWFEGFIFAVIMLNCATISTDNFGSADGYSHVIKIIDDVIVWIYFAEMLVKMVALGVFVRRWGYFYSKWNIIDCAISVVGVIAFIVIHSISDEYSSAAKVVSRVLRVLRPFRVLTALSIFRTVLRSIANALIRLTHVLVLSIVFTMVMGLIALHFFHGTISYRCHAIYYDPFTNATYYSMEEEAPACAASFLPPAMARVPVPSAAQLPWGPTCTGHGGWPSPTHASPATTALPTTAWASTVPIPSPAGNSSTLAPTTVPPTTYPPYDPDAPECALQETFPFLTSELFQSNASSVAGYFSQSYITLPTDTPYHVYLEWDELPSLRNGLVCPYSQLCLKGDNPSGDRDNFDNVLSAFLLLYTILCLEAWSSVMYYIVDAKGLAAEIYFVILVIVGAVVILNLALTIITDAFSRSVAMEDELKDRQALIRKGDREEAERATQRLMEGRTELAKITKKVVEAQREEVSKRRMLFFTVKHTIYVFMRTQGYIYFLSFLSFVNWCLLASSHEGMDTVHRDVVDIACKTVACLFLADGVVFAASSPLKRTVRSPTTLFRLVVGVLAVLEWFLWGSGALSAFFAVRILQPMRRIKSLHVTFAYLYKALKASFTLVALLLCVVFLFAIVGMQLFSGKLCGLDSTSTLQTNTTVCDGVPRTNFDNVGYGIVTVFIIVVGDGWRGIMNDCMSRVSEVSALYFCLCYLIGGYLIMNLFVAVLFSQSNDDGDDLYGDLDGDEEGDDEGADDDFDASTVHGGGDTASEYSTAASGRARARSFVQSMIVDRIDAYEYHGNGDGNEGRRSSGTMPLLQLEDSDGQVELVEVGLLSSRTGSSSNLKAGLGGQPSLIALATPRGSAPQQQHAVTVRQMHRNRYKDKSGAGPTPLLGPSASSSTAMPPISPRNRTVSVVDPFTLTVSAPGDVIDGDDQGGGGGGKGKRRSGSSMSGVGSGSASTSSFKASKKWANRSVMSSMKRQYAGDGNGTATTTNGGGLLTARGRATSAFNDVADASVASFSSNASRGGPRGGRWRNDNDPSSSAVLMAGGNRRAGRARSPSSTAGSPLGNLVSEMRRTSGGGGNASTANMLSSATLTATRSASGQSDDEEFSDEEDADGDGIDETWDDLGDYFTPIPRRQTRRRKKKGGPTPTGGPAAVAAVGAAAAAAQQKMISVMSAMEQLTAVTALGAGERTAAELMNNKHLNIISRACRAVVTNRAFSWFMLVVILFSMVSLAMVDPLTYPDSDWNHLTIWSDFICGAMFFIEFLLKLGWLGFYSRSAKTKGYFNNSWNTFDFCLMVIGLVPAVSLFYSETQFNDAVDVLRVVRAFRPFSFVGRHSGLELIFRSFIISLPPIANISVIVLLVWFVFAAAAMQLYGGMLWACGADDWGDKTYNYPHLKTQADCVAAGFTWENNVANYDNFGEALLTLFKVASNDNWHPIMFAAVDTVDRGEGPIPGHRPYMVCFFIAFIVLESFFLINFFISVMVDTYFLTKAKMEAALRAQSIGSDILDDEQLNFVNMYRRALIFVKPPLHISIQKGSFRHLLRLVARSRQFEFAYLFFAFVHTCILATQHMEDPPIDFDSLLYIDLAFTCVFWGFVGIKMTVLGVSSFFEQNTRRTEVLINLVTTAGVLGELIAGPMEGLTIFRLCRVLRLYRTIYMDSEMRLLVDTITVSMPSIIKVFFILMMTFYLFAVIGMSLFGRVRWQINKKDGSVGNYANFQRLDSAFMVLLRVATLDDWAELMHSCMMEPPLCDRDIGDCGIPWVAAIYFCLLVLILQWIGLNFFTAALMDAFNNAEKEERYAVQKPHIDEFRRQWKELVGMDTTMPFYRVQQFIARLGGPLGPHFDALYYAKLAMAHEEAMGKKGGGGGGGASDAVDPDEAIAILSTSNGLEGTAADGGHSGAGAGAGASRTSSGGPPIDAFGAIDPNRPPPPPSFHRVLAFLTRLKLPMYGDGTHVSQSDLFDALMRYYYGVPLPKAVDAQLAAVIKRRFEMGQFQRHVMAGMAGGGATDGAGHPRERVPLQHVAAAALIQARWRGVRVRRIVNATLAEHRAMMHSEGLSMAHIQQAKRDRAKRDRLLAQPMGVEIL